VDIVIAPKTAEVGQMIIVKSVDESGRPIMWEAVDNVKYIASSVEPSDKNTMWIDTSDNSVDFEQVEIDATFTKSGFAADAQLTGAAISSLEYRLESKLDELTKIHVGSVEPTEKISGMVWIDTSEPSQTTSEV
jgi:hypothetical protein